MKNPPHNTSPSEPQPSALSSHDASDAAPPKLGKTVTTIGLAMFCGSIALAVLGVEGAALHNVLQFGGIAGAVVGAVLWKGLNK